MESKDAPTEELIRYLINVWGKEISSEELQEMDIARINSLIRIIKKETSDIEKMENELNRHVLRREIDLLKFILGDIWRVREEKIIAALLNDDLIDYQKLLPHEKKIISTIRNIISIDPLKYIKEYISDERLDYIVDEEIKVRKKDIKYVLLLAKESAPVFIGVDGIVYRGIYKYDIVMIPKVNYNYFKKTKFYSLH